jgi:Fe-S cluster assembly protein SufB
MILVTKTMPELGEYRWGFRDEHKALVKFNKGLSPDVVKRVSEQKNEPGWMTDFRLKSLEIFYSKPTPTWGGDLSELDYDDITYYVKPSDKSAESWDEVPDEIRNTFDKIGLEGAEERHNLGGVEAQYESEVVYHSIRTELSRQGIIFTDTDTALREHPEIFKKYFATVIPPEDNKFAALNSALWSGGSFIYVPKGVTCDVPLQMYFRIGSEKMGQFERTLIIADDDSFVHYIEGCSASMYSNYSLHDAVVEIVVNDGARVRYSTIQNWASNIYNLVTKRACAKRNATMEWVDGNIGASLTMKYPSVYLMGEGARGSVLSIAVAGKGQHQDTGAKMVHMAPNTTSTIVSKSISKQGGKTTYRGLVSHGPQAVNCKSNVKCDTLMIDPGSKSDTIPHNRAMNDEVAMEHEASVSKVSEDQLFYLTSRGLSEEEATQMIVMGFIEPFTRELPMEYAVEMNKLIQFEMIGSVG